MEFPMLRVRFEPRIQARELSAFRGAVAGRVGLEHDWFHNHDNEAGSRRAYHYRYPLVQYKLMDGYPALLFLGPGVDQAMHLFAQPGWSLTFTRQRKQARLAEMKRQSARIGLHARPQPYRLRSWVAFNQSNYEAYKRTPGLAGRLQLMERALAGHILALATGLGYQFPRRFEAVITDWQRPATVTFSGNKMLAFDLAFQSDAMLPPHAGLGRGAGRGYGELERGGGAAR